MRELYVIVEWPDIQYFMDHKDWNKCRMLYSNNSNLCEYAVPINLYNEIYGKSRKEINK